MVRRRWAVAVLVATLASVDFYAITRMQHSAGTVASLNQVLGWTAFVALLTFEVLMLGHRLRSDLHARRIKRTYARLAARDASLQPTTIPQHGSKVRRWPRRS